MGFLARFLPAKRQMGAAQNGEEPKPWSSNQNAFDGVHEEFDDCMVPFDEPPSSPSPKGMPDNLNETLKAGTSQEEDLVYYPPTLYGNNPKKIPEHGLTHGRAQGQDDPPSDEDTSPPSRDNRDLASALTDQGNDQDDVSVSISFSTDHSVEAALVPLEESNILKITLSFSSHEDENNKEIPPLQTPISLLSCALSNQKKSEEAENHMTIPVSELVPVRVDCQSFSSLEDIEYGNNVKAGSSSTNSKHNLVSLLSYQDSDDDDVTSESKKSRETKRAPFTRRVSGIIRKKRHQNGVSSQFIWMHGSDQDQDECLKTDGKNLAPIDDAGSVSSFFSTSSQEPKSDNVKPTALLPVQIDCQSYASQDDLEHGKKIKKTEEPRREDAKESRSTQEPVAPSKASSIIAQFLSSNSTQESDSDTSHPHEKADPLANHNKRKRRRNIKIAIISSLVAFGLVLLACAIIFVLERSKQRDPYSPDQDPLLAAVKTNPPSILFPTGSPSNRAPIDPQMERPWESPTESPTKAGPLVANFFVIGDLPYNEYEKDRLIKHVNSLPDDAEFLVHVGDIRDAENATDCKVSEFEMVGDILKRSPVPVFIVPGGKCTATPLRPIFFFFPYLTRIFFLQYTDNEYNDCPNLDESWGDWMTVFGNFEKHWDSSLNVNRDPGRPENFYFVHKRMLYIGLNIVGGVRHDEDEWETRLDDQWQWTKGLIETHILEEPSDAAGVVIFAHADPRPTAHASFFYPLRNYIATELNNEIPFIYVNGDQHYFQFDDNFYGQSNFHRIMVEGGSEQPPLQMTVTVPNDTNHDKLLVQDIYEYERFP
jgi:hypothetical protein